MKVANDFGHFLIIIAWVALFFVLVRPGSQGPSLVQNFTQGVTSLVGAATGGGTWGSK
jgi:hypothetical protein